MSRITVGKCSACGKHLTAKAHAVKERMHLTCPCGCHNEVTPSREALGESVSVRSSVDHQFKQLVRQLHKVGSIQKKRKHWDPSRDPRTKASLALFNFVHQWNASEMMNLVHYLETVLEKADENDSIVAAKVLTEIKEESCIMVLLHALRHQHGEVRSIAAYGLRQLGDIGMDALKNVSVSLREEGLLEAETVIEEGRLLYKKVENWAREVATKQPGTIIEVYNDEWALTDGELHKIASKLRREGFWVSDGSSHPGSSRYRGFWVRFEGK